MGHIPFESREALMSAVKIEAIVCGDEIREKDDGNTIEIYNWHAGEVRWKGVVVEKEKRQSPWYEEVSMITKGPFSGIGSGEVPHTKRPYSDSFYEEIGVMRKDD